MRRWVKYFLLSALLAVIISVLCIFTLGRLSASQSVFFDRILNMIFWTLILICLIQVGLFLFYHYKQLRPGFFIAFTGTYAFIFLVMYGITVYMKYETREFYKNLMAGVRGPEDFDVMSCFTGMHSWYLVPVVIQVLIYILLYRQRKQAASKVVD